MTPPAPAGPVGAAPHFGAQRPDHSPPESLSDDELARAIDSLERKLASARRMFVMAKTARIAFFAAMVLGGFALLAVGPAPFLELLEGSRLIATSWDLILWWLAVLAAASLLGAVMTQAVRQRRRRAAGWRHRVAELDLRLADARRELARRRSTTGPST